MNIHFIKERVMIILFMKMQSDLCLQCTLFHIQSMQFSTASCILMGNRNVTVKFYHVLHVAHKHKLHKLTMARILSQASGYLKGDVH